MGNCCTSDNRAEDLGSLRDAKAAVEDSGAHAPAPTFAQEVPTMNVLNDTVKAKQAKLKQYTPGSIPNMFATLPNMGPYKYANGATYEGQYKNGLRHGLGRQVSINF